MHDLQSLQQNHSELLKLDFSQSRQSSMPNWQMFKAQKYNI